MGLIIAENSVSQKKHWRKEHRLRCSPFKIVQGGDDVGRYVVATRDIRAGEVIIEEQPVTAGPKQFTHAVCLGCFSRVDGSYSCSGCGWPMCGAECEAEGRLHKAECDTLANCKFKPKLKEEYGEQNPIYECLTPLRYSPFIASLLGL